MMILKVMKIYDDFISNISNDTYMISPQTKIKYRDNQNA